MIRVSFAKLDCLTPTSKGWGVKVSGDLGGNAMHMTGQTVTVHKRNGGSEQVTLGGRIATANGRDAWYTIQREQRVARATANRTAAHKRISKECTDAQYALLLTLLDERDPGDDTMFNPLPAQTQLMKADASQLISRLKEHPRR